MTAVIVVMERVRAVYWGIRTRLSALWQVACGRPLLYGWRIEGGLIATPERDRTVLTVPGRLVSPPHVWPLIAENTITESAQFHEIHFTEQPRP